LVKLTAVRSLRYRELGRRGRRRRGDVASGTQVPGAFSLVRKEAGMSEVEARHYLANGEETRPDGREAIEWAAETRAQMVDLKFCDLLGAWQHMTLPLAAFDESAFDEGLGFDGSSIRGWQGIAESDMLLMPDPGSAVLD